MEGENLRLAVKEVGKLLKSELKKAAKADGFKASGNLNKSFKYRVKKNELHMFANEYANALSGGISTGNSGSEQSFKALQSNLIKWAKSKGMRPLFRQYKLGPDGKSVPTGKFRKVYESSWKSLGFVLARSLRKKGISERFGYKGSGFIDRVQKETKEQIKTILKEGYRKDVIDQLKLLKEI